jgi:malate/lactate dehydrogenase
MAIPRHVNAIRANQSTMIETHAHIRFNSKECSIPVWVTLSMPGILGRNGVSRILEPAMSEEELQRLQRSANTLEAASRRIGALAND